MLPPADMSGLMAAADIVLSLHRSEGFGLVPAEAMQLGKPVVATGWSGNMDFMNARNSAPVSYSLVPVQDPRRRVRCPTDSSGPRQMSTTPPIGCAGLPPSRRSRRHLGETARADIARQLSPRPLRADCNSSRSRKGGLTCNAMPVRSPHSPAQAPFAPMSRKRLVSYRYMMLRASTAAGTLGTGLLQTFVFARVLTPERFSLFIFLGALG